MPINILGREQLNIPLKNVLESLQIYRNVTVTTQNLGYVPSYIFIALKKNNLKVGEVIKGFK